MVQSEFTKQEARLMQKVVDELFVAIPKKRRIEYLGHLNDILLFLAAAERAAPEAKEKK